MKRKPLVYIAGPYTTPDPVANTHHTIHLAEEIERTYGVAILIPHPSLLWHAISPAPIDVWYERDLHQLERCDAVIRLAGPSTGADAEVEHANSLGIPVFLAVPEGTAGLRRYATLSGGRFGNWAASKNYALNNQ